MSATKITARDIPSRQFVPLLSQYLQQSGKILPISLFGRSSSSSTNSTNSKLGQFEKWYFAIAASTLYQFYLHPSFQLPLIKSVNIHGSQANSNNSRKMAQAEKFAQSAVVSQLTELGWLIRDPTGIIYVSKGTCDSLDEIAAITFSSNNCNNINNTSSSAHNTEINNNNFEGEKMVPCTNI